eukprot:s1_g2495.t1
MGLSLASTSAAAEDRPPGALEWRIQTAAEQLLKEQPQADLSTWYRHVTSLVQASDPAADRQRDHDAELYGFIGINYGMGYAVPGVECQTDMHPYRFTPQKIYYGDVIYSRVGQEKYNAALKEYALAYNTIVVKQRHYNNWAAHFCKPILTADKPPMPADAPRPIEIHETPRPLGVSDKR